MELRFGFSLHQQFLPVSSLYAMPLLSSSVLRNLEPI
jgi:hypothetical protein